MSWRKVRVSVSRGTMRFSSGRARRLIHFDFVYSSACPCSDELSEHARHGRGVYSIPHSQRSKARVLVEVAEGRKLALEDLQKANQNDAFIQCLIGQTYEKSGEKGKAMEFYRKAAATTAHNPPGAYARPFARKKLE